MPYKQNGVWHHEDGKPMQCQVCRGEGNEFFCGLWVLCVKHRDEALRQMNADPSRSAINVLLGMADEHPGEETEAYAGSSHPYPDGHQPGEE